MIKQMKAMFQVESKNEIEDAYVYTEYGVFKMVHRAKRYTVHNVRDDGNGYPMFLIYDNGQWLNKSAKYFTPVEG